MPGTEIITRRADPHCPGAQPDNGSRWKVKSEQRLQWTLGGCLGNSCAGALGTSLAEGTAVLWPGHLEVNYKDRVEEVRLMGLGWSTEEGRQGTNKLGA